jgi:aspartate kinase
MNNIIVQKFGGTSVGSTDLIKKVAKRVVKDKRQGKKIIVVVSAMGKSTDHLVKMVYEVHDNPSSREMDVLLATGEQVSISLLAMAIEALGEKAISLTGAQCGIITDSQHKNARISEIKTNRLLTELYDDHIVIVAGFQGITNQLDISTLGRGGSDTTAVALAAALKADYCEIYTDVDGVYSADPRKVSNARKMDEISYDEMLELAKLGAQVLHPRSVEMARNYKVALYVRPSHTDGKGTKIAEVNNLENYKVRGVTIDSDIARLSITGVPDKPGIAFRLFEKLAENNITIDMILQNLNHNTQNDISFTIPLECLEACAKIAINYKEEIGATDVVMKENVSKLSVVGTGITSNPIIASKMFGALYELGVNIEMISTSETKLSCIIEEQNTNEVLDRIHSLFFSDGE